MLKCAINSTKNCTSCSVKFRKFVSLILKKNVSFLLQNEYHYFFYSRTLLLGSARLSKPDNIKMISVFLYKVH